MHIDFVAQLRQLGILPTHEAQPFYYTKYPGIQLIHVAIFEIYLHDRHRDSFKTVPSVPN